MEDEKNLLYEKASDSPNIVLPPSDAKVVQAVLTEALTVPPISANQLLQTLKKDGVSSPAFKPLRDFLAQVEGVKYTTYKIADRMTIGIGLDIAPPHNNTQALFYTLNPALGELFPQMQVTAGLPQPPLTDEQVDTLLWLTLMSISGLADTPFPYNQLIALQSLAYNVPIYLFILCLNNYGKKIM